MIYHTLMTAIDEYEKAKERVIACTLATFPACSTVYFYDNGMDLETTKALVSSKQDSVGYLRVFHSIGQIINTCIPISEVYKAPQSRSL